MNISTVVCTFNRSASLERTLSSLAEAALPTEGSWELVVVDNNSTDDTRGVVETFRRRCGRPVRYVLEETAGLSHARNRGIAAAAGEIIAFTDDDVVVDRNWLRGIAEAFAGTDAMAVGGRILPLWEAPPPRWLTGRLYAYLALADYGEQPLVLDSPRVWGANLFFRKEAFRKYGGFDTGLGRAPGKLYAGEEVGFLRKLLGGGEKVLYHPGAVVYHHIPRQRLSKRYFHRWTYDQGELEMISRNDGGGMAASARHVGRLLGREVPRYALHALRGTEHAIAHELKIFHTLGCLSGIRKGRRAGGGRRDRGGSEGSG